jgi:hypothetical protein
VQGVKLVRCDVEAECRSTAQLPPPMYNKSRCEAILHGLWSGTDCHTDHMDGGGGAEDRGSRWGGGKADAG